MTATVHTPYTAQYADPITLQPGDEVLLGQEETDEKWKGWIWATHGNQAGWIPMQILADRVDNRARIAAAYTARELTVAAGEVVTVLQALNGWYWVARGSGSGWVPADCVDLQL